MVAAHLVGEGCDWEVLKIFPKNDDIQSNTGAPWQPMAVIPERGEGAVLTAVDVQQILMQSGTVQKVQQTQQQHPDTEQKYLALQLSEARKLQQEKVNNAEEAERILLRDKEERRQRKKMTRERPPPQDGSPRESGALPSSEEQGEYIDIRV